MTTSWCSPARHHARCALLCFALAALVILQGCTSGGSRATDKRSLERAGLQRFQVAPVIVAYVEPAPRGEVLTVFIESDGARWARPDSPPLDPSPASSVSIALTLREIPYGSVAYLGRPCQYVNQISQNTACPQRLWHEARYGDEVVSMMDSALTTLLARTGHQRLRLVGHSGGGVIAMLTAARRSDVDCIVTIGSPLHVRRWVRTMGLSDLTDSLDPEDVQANLGSVAQTHLLGADDDIIPITIYHANAAGEFRVRVVPGFNHFSPWAASWAQIRARSCLFNKK